MCQLSLGHEPQVGPSLTTQTLVAYQPFVHQGDSGSDEKQAAARLLAE